MSNKNTDSKVILFDYQKQQLQWLSTLIKGPIPFSFGLPVFVAKDNTKKEKKMNNLQLRKTLWIVQRQYPFVELADIQAIHDSLVENSEINLSTWTAKELSDICLDILRDL